MSSTLELEISSSLPDPHFTNYLQSIFSNSSESTVIIHVFNEKYYSHNKTILINSLVFSSLLSVVQQHIAKNLLFTMTRTVWTGFHGIIQTGLK